MVVIAIPLFIWLIFRENSKTKDILSAKLSGLADVNSTRGTAFPTTSDELYKSLLLGDADLRQNAVIFDPDKRKIALIKAPGNTLELQDFDYIRGWEFKYEITRSGPGGITKTISNAYIAVSTSDIHCPLLQFSLPTVQVGEVWIARLNTMCG